MLKEKKTKKPSMFESECYSPVHKRQWKGKLSHYALSVFYLYVTNKGKLFDFSRDALLFFVCFVVIYVDHWFCFLRHQTEEYIEAKRSMTFQKIIRLNQVWDTQLKLWDK